MKHFIVEHKNTVNLIMELIETKQQRTKLMIDGNGCLNRLHISQILIYVHRLLEDDTPNLKSCKRKHRISPVTIFQYGG